jgi:ATP-binding protein involved in chromosome partitioning
VAKLAEKTNVRVLGIIENMAYYEVNGKRDYIFGKEGGKKLAASLNTTLLGEIPLMTSMREGSDTGNPVSIYGSPEQISLFESIVSKIEKVES